MVISGSQYSYLDKFASRSICSKIASVLAKLEMSLLILALMSELRFILKSRQGRKTSKSNAQ